MNQAIKLDPNDPNAYYLSGLFDENLEGDFNQAIEDLTHASQLDPKDADSVEARGFAYEKNGEYDKAISDYHKAILLDPKSPDAYKDLAWLLSTCAEGDLRDGKKAVENATKACELMGWNDPDAIDTLAAANAEAGDFDNAIKLERQFLKTSKLSDKAVAEAQSRLVLYQIHKPYHSEQ